MSLIDRLGGYGKAKDIITQNIKDFEEAVDEVGIYHPSSGWIVHEDLVKELLEYRRENNIYELGDKIVFIDKFMHDEVMTVSDGNNVALWMDNDTKHAVIEMVRHATDAEIDANRRLDL
ncbi:hypothetical protein HADU_04038 [Acinetobacter sp. HA]|uniref:hypothetical protein n=1 Tax=Acinetobacter sp. HA TaxID=1173062 RepID=UPI000263DEBD|nr:hypothetical protein [Acinetobacter sp. HA]EIM39996.1 hypothetical protein HADU_04038 [Acinetobacter sp. HA]